MDVDFVSLCERGGSRKLMQTEVFSHFYDIIGFKVTSCRSQLFKGLIVLYTKSMQPSSRLASISSNYFEWLLLPLLMPSSDVTTPLL